MNPHAPFARQHWRSLGHVLVAAGEHASHASHASYPTPLVLADGRVRMFYSPRDAGGGSTIYSIDLALSPRGVERLGAPAGPWLEGGARGGFDDAGTSVSWVAPLPDGGFECLYLGWTLGVSVPFRNTIGRAIAGPGETRLSRCAPVPVIDRSAEDPFTLGYPWVVDAGSQRLVWYGTHLSWGEGWMDMDHVIRRASSADGGASWVRDPVPALTPAGGEEWALSRPCVLRAGDEWVMWFSRRYDHYKLGFARSPDGVSWTREDEAVSFTSPEEPWEAGTRTYPAVFAHEGRHWMAYNGTGYGRSGFGLAILED